MKASALGEQSTSASLILIGSLDQTKALDESYPMDTLYQDVNMRSYFGSICQTKDGRVASFLGSRFNESLKVLLFYEGRQDAGTHAGPIARSELRLARRFDEFFDIVIVPKFLSLSSLNVLIENGLANGPSCGLTENGAFRRSGREVTELDSEGSRSRQQAPSNSFPSEPLGSPVNPHDVAAGSGVEYSTKGPRTSRRFFFWAAVHRSQSEGDASESEMTDIPRLDFRERIRAKR
ncbi:hypothetical protein AgCh_032697 [Apium graveolens]